MVETALALAETRWRVDILFAAVTGVRASEQVALRWRHIDFDGGLVRIESRVDAYKDEDECKSAAGIRRVPLKPRLIEELRGWRRLTKYPAEDDMVFPGRWGGFRDHSAMTNRQWNPIRAILAERYPDEKVDTNWHALRHFAVSCWIATDVNWKKVQTWVGHADIAFTMNRYGHIFADGVDDTRVLESIRRIIG